MQFSGTSADAPKGWGVRWLVCGMLFAAAAINYIDRQVIGILKRHFADVKTVKPKASRADSSELYLVATGFKGR